MSPIFLRRGAAGDLAHITRIQSLSPQAAQWNPSDYLEHDFTVALCEDRIAGFVVARSISPDESEILNLAVDPSHRRRGIGRALIGALVSRHPGSLFLEVRESNHAARSFYASLGFQEFAVRPRYYDAASESAIVMKFHSC